ncbi:methyltransferase domain-containing protein [Bacillus aerolatus]|uniref:Methyltransferase domain-containing protein n=1 Tax=Bacillus aerolatus TaxID=2653354 RepID=A0A6I1FD95_9BACI|nr:class I SAM-dependent methyltransferase [Bacillus aerolatus]KAB7705358.1 methyltransferase domain-containing protein [Bacillus aerolatus]
MAVTDRKLIVKDEVLEWTISTESFLQTARVKQGERVFWIGELSSPLAARLTVEKANITAVSPSVNVKSAEKKQFDGVIAQTGIHFLDEGDEWLRKSFDLLKPGGRLVVDLAEAGTLQHVKGVTYGKSLPDYWDLLREAGFETIFVQQIAARSLVEVIGQGWTELAETTEFPAIVNRFIALKGY